MISRICILAFLLAFLLSCKQKELKIPPKTDNNSLLWEVSGNGLGRSSYLYGTMHIICDEDAGISDNFKKLINQSDAVYFEIDMDNMEEMLAAVHMMKMKGDTTLEELLTDEQLERVKKTINHNSSLPYSMLRAYHPLLTATILAESFLECKKTGIEETVMKIAQDKKIPIEGLETLEFQISVFDRIPYQDQAKYLVDFVDSVNASTAKIYFDRMFDTYLTQDIKVLDSVMLEMDRSIAKFSDILLYERNRNWIAQLKKIMPGHSYVFAVGAGHLPGERGLINLLRNQGYTVTALENNLPKSNRSN